MASSSASPNSLSESFSSPNSQQQRSSSESSALDHVSFSFSDDNDISPNISPFAPSAFSPSTPSSIGKNGQDAINGGESYFSSPLTFSPLPPRYPHPPSPSLSPTLPSSFLSASSLPPSIPPPLLIPQSASAPSVSALTIPDAVEEVHISSPISVSAPPLSSSLFSANTKPGKLGRSSSLTSILRTKPSDITTPPPTPTSQSGRRQVRFNGMVQVRVVERMMVMLAQEQKANDESLLNLQNAENQQQQSQHLQQQQSQQPIVVRSDMGVIGQDRNALLKGLPQSLLDQTSNKSRVYKDDDNSDEEDHDSHSDALSSDVDEESNQDSKRKGKTRLIQPSSASSSSSSPSPSSSSPSNTIVSHLFQCYSNMFSSSLKSIPDGWLTSRSLQVKAKREQGYLIISVLILLSVVFFAIAAGAGNLNACDGRMTIFLLGSAIILAVVATAVINRGMSKIQQPRVAKRKPSPPIILPGNDSDNSQQQVGQFEEALPTPRRGSPSSSPVEMEIVVQKNEVVLNAPAPASSSSASSSNAKKYPNSPRPVKTQSRISGGDVDQDMEPLSEERLDGQVPSRNEHVQEDSEESSSSNGKQKKRPTMVLRAIFLVAIHIFGLYGAIVTYQSSPAECTDTSPALFYTAVLATLGFFVFVGMELVHFARTSHR